MRLKFTTASGETHQIELDVPDVDPYWAFSELTFKLTKKVQEGHTNAVMIYLIDPDLKVLRYAHLWSTASNRVLTQISEAQRT